MRQDPISTGGIGCDSGSNTMSVESLNPLLVRLEIENLRNKG